MRKNILFGLKTLLTAARVTFYTRQAPTATPKFSLEPMRTPTGPDRTLGMDDWMFEGGRAFDLQTNALTSEMSRLSDSLTGLRETLSLISGETPFPVETLTQRPCVITHHDADLFDGEPAPQPPHQENTIGGEGVFLFGDEPAFDDQREQHAA